MNNCLPSVHAHQINVLKRTSKLKLARYLGGTRHFPCKFLHFSLLKKTSQSRVTYSQKSYFELHTLASTPNYFANNHSTINAYLLGTPLKLQNCTNHVTILFFMVITYQYPDPYTDVKTTAKMDPRLKNLKIKTGVLKR